MASQDENTPPALVNKNERRIQSEDSLILEREKYKKRAVDARAAPAFSADYMRNYYDDLKS